MNRDLRAMLGKARELLEEVRVWWQKRTPVVRIADVRDGQFVRIAGRIVDGEPLTAPITARTCVCFDAGVFGHAQLDRRRDVIGEPMFAWQTLTRRLHGRPFVVDDGSGTALVDPRGAVVQLRLDVRTDSLTGYPEADAELAALRGQHDKIEWGEGVLQVGEDVVALARAMVGRADDPALYRASSDARVHLAGAPERAAHH